jgi:hypothetical protein
MNYSRVDIHRDTYIDTCLPGFIQVILRMADVIE